MSNLSEFFGSGDFIQINNSKLIFIEIHFFIYKFFYLQLMNSELAALQEKLEETMQKKEKIDQFLINSRGIFRQQVRAEEEVPGIQIVGRRQKKRAYCTCYARHIPFFFTCSIFCLQSIF